MLNITKTIENGNAVLKPAGRLDTLTAPDMEAAIKEVLPGLTSLTLDLSELEYISSAGLRVLLLAKKAIGAGGELTVCNVGETVMEILEVTGFSEILSVR